MGNSGKNNKSMIDSGLVATLSFLIHQYVIRLPKVATLTMQRQVYITYRRVRLLGTHPY